MHKKVTHVETESPGWSKCAIMLLQYTIHQRNTEIAPIALFVSLLT